jgi:hypothetical protein
MKALNSGVVSEWKSWDKAERLGTDVRMTMVTIMMIDKSWGLVSNTSTRY